MESFALSHLHLWECPIFLLSWERENCGKADTIPISSIVFLQPFIAGNKQNKKGQNANRPQGTPGENRWQCFPREKGCPRPISQLRILEQAQRENAGGRRHQAKDDQYFPYGKEPKDIPMLFEILQSCWRKPRAPSPEANTGTSGTSWAILAGWVVDRFPVLLCFPLVSGGSALCRAGPRRVFPALFLGLLGDALSLS